MRYAVLSLLALAVVQHLSAGDCDQTDWLTLPSTYSHDATGQRVTQFQPIEAPRAPQQELRTSGYTHTRSSINYGQSSDNYHRVERWGDPVRPYGEWRFPYRPFGTPYPNWGAPYTGFNLGFGGFGGFRGFPGHGAGGYGQGYGPGHAPYPPKHPGGDHDKEDLDKKKLFKFYDQDARDGGIFRERRRFDFPPSDPNLFRPYPAGPGTPYPVAPYYDGYYPVYRD